MSPVVFVRNLEFGYNHTPLLRGVSLTLSPGKLLIICGQSGSGKSSLMRVLMGLEKPKSGIIKIFDKEIGGLTDSEYNLLKSRIGCVFQNAALISTQTVEGNLKLPLVYHNLANIEEIEKRVENTLEMLLIKKYRSHFPTELSLGLQKRAAVARAIINSPELIFMDEPTSGLDSISKKLIIPLIENIRMVHNVSMIIISNDMTIAREMDADIGVLKEGEMLEPMRYNQLKGSPDSFVKELLKEMQDK
jgi:phospholipid/cholesterol/gamma-HCH transport system ATP-binding protein